MKEITLKFIGDIFPGDEIFTCGFGIKSKTTEANAEMKAPPAWVLERLR